jgi:hypothetical protein
MIKHVITADDGCGVTLYFVERNCWVNNEGQATLFNTAGDANAQLTIMSEEDLGRNPLVVPWELSPRLAALCRWLMGADATTDFNLLIARAKEILPGPPPNRPVGENEYPCHRCGKVANENHGSWNENPLLFFCSAECHTHWGQYPRVVEPCTHPDHVDGTSCEVRAVGCRADCPCCCPPENQLPREEWMYFVEVKEPGRAEIVVCFLDLEYAEDTETTKMFADAFTLWAYLVDQQVVRVCVIGPDVRRESQFENYFHRLGMEIQQHPED